MRKLALIVVILFLSVGVSNQACAQDQEKEIHYISVASDRHDTTDAISKAMSGMPSTVEYVCLDGDMVDSSNKYNSSTILSEVQDVFPSLDNTTVSIVKGVTHDDGCTDDAGILVGETKLIYTAYNSDESVACYVYGISYQDMYSKNSQTSCTAAENFMRWVDELTDNAPIIVCSHIPLHYQRDDNGYAPIWSKALNYAATGVETTEAGNGIKRNVVFLHAHNHTTESNSEYYIPQGSTMKVYDSNTSHYTYYTYTTAGYLRNNKSATLIAVDSNGELTITKYANQEVSNIYKSKGAKTDFSNTYDASSATHTIEAAIDDGRKSRLMKFENATITVNIGDEDYTVPTNGLTYNGDEGEDVEITYSSSNESIATVDEYGIVAITGEVGTTTITAKMEQTDDYRAGSASYKLTVTSGSTDSDSIYVLVDKLTVGKNYIIAYGKSGTVTIFGQSSGSQERTTVAVKTGDTPYIETGDTDLANYVWKATASINTSCSDYPRLINNGYAVYPSSGKSNSSSSSGSSGSSNKLSLSFSNDLETTSGAVYTRYWVYENGVLAGKTTNSSSDPYYMTYSSNKFTATSTAPSNTIYIFEKKSKQDVEEETTHVKGDVNSDNEVTAQDASLILQHVAGKIDINNLSNQ